MPAGGDPWEPCVRLPAEAFTAHGGKGSLSPQTENPERNFPKGYFSLVHVKRVIQYKCSNSSDVPLSEVLAPSANTEGAATRNRRACVPGSSGLNLECIFLEKKIIIVNVFPGQLLEAYLTQPLKL